MAQQRKQTQPGQGVKPVAATDGVEKGGCNYGRGTRWAIAITLPLIIGVACTSLGFSYRGVAHAANLREDVVNRIDDQMRAVDDRQDLNNETLGRIDERLKALERGMRQITDNQLALVPLFDAILEDLHEVKRGRGP